MFYSIAVPNFFFAKFMGKYLPSIFSHTPNINTWLKSLYVVIMECFDVKYIF